MKQFCKDMQEIEAEPNTDTFEGEAYSIIMEILANIKK